MFRFKQFSINQERTAMKVGTDGVLLGAWSPLKNSPYNILDIGSGTGLIALMLAQRSHAEQIDALEIDENAYEECVENFENSPWNDRLFCYHADLTTFTEEFFEEEEYDLIVSNPPFYTDAYKSQNTGRDLARFEEALPFEELIECTVALLSEKGVFSVIIPFKEEEHFITICQSFDLYPFQITRVKGTPETEIKRSLLAFSFENKETEISSLTIETNRHEYTAEYVELTQAFYLKM
ncbi:methyltransferase [Flavobacterium sp. NRK F10]|uniref:tRNA1(Val) (adenine(37)-N6)-methyltransferase n=1 Tax=Flavobacterium sediminis TaxID=2201181 RepID=A0A2U8QUI7_9FLAO|nr:MULTISPECIES: methyltransferase [Flavobacterium]AWM13880.1 tRNA (adenine-N(6)-)-methyltransferase [Flavobacterium sediminis]MCO6175050.1 methyltransferase [Flavobacterium sp. NRK F10]